MKSICISFLFFLSLSFVNTTNDSVNEMNYNRFIINAAIRQLFEKMRGIILNGSSEHDVPVLDPYKFEHSFLNIEEDIFSVKIEVTNGAFSGLGNFQLEQSKFDMKELKIALTLNFPSLVFESERYEMEGNIYEIVPLAGRGKMYFEVENLCLNGKIYLEQSEDCKSVLIKTLEDVSFSIQNIKSTTQFDQNIDDILNGMINDLLADYLTRFNKKIASKYAVLLKGFLNPFLDKFDSWKYIAILP